ncbi:MAG TPA: GDP-mannose 4,6-dehydratase [Candidatus Aquabacterium excrementipullorum]|nr:GDP-mannose 4,6-dehydratase [Candidatus Aquabacterium excrementipullorum]
MKTPRTVLITGILGQDGSYLADHALRLGQRVVGGIRGELSAERSWRLDHLGITRHIEFVPLDLLNAASIDHAIESTRPDLIFNFAAQSSVGDSFNTPIATAEAGGIGAVRIFEKARTSGNKIRVFQASSSEIFGDITDSQHSEESFFNPKTPYGATKLFAHIMAEAYRASYGTHVSTGILFNHESPLRGINFVTRKITNSLTKVKLGLIEGFSLGNLDARRDWSHAKDFVTAIWDMLALDTPDNFVLASGKLTSVREFVDLAAQALDIELSWEGSGQHERGIDRRTGRAVVTVNPEFYRPYDPAQPLADIRKAQRVLGWQPQHSLQSLVDEMVQFELKQLSPQ